MSPDHVAFLDTDDINTGTDWDLKIAKAAQLSKVRACNYSPNYFSKNRNHEYCAKEFHAFLKRQDTLSYERYVEANLELFKLRDVRNIIPILWYSDRFLKKYRDLPPPMVRMIHYHLRRSRFRNCRRVQEQRNGKNYDKAFGNLSRRSTEALAVTIHDCSNKPLPPLPDAPKFSTLRNAFWDRPEPLEVGERDHDANSIVAGIKELSPAEGPHVEVVSERLPRTKSTSRYRSSLEQPQAIQRGRPTVAARTFPAC